LRDLSQFNIEGKECDDYVLDFRQLIESIYARDVDLALTKDQNLVYLLFIDRRPHFEVNG
jgi:hypothetical protein